MSNNEAESKKFEDFSNYLDHNVCADEQGRVVEKCQIIEEEIYLKITFEIIDIVKDPQVPFWGKFKSSFHVNDKLIGKGGILYANPKNFIGYRWTTALKQNINGCLSTKLTIMFTNEGLTDKPIPPEKKIKYSLSFDSDYLFGEGIHSQNFYGLTINCIIEKISKESFEGMPPLWGKIYNQAEYVNTTQIALYKDYNDPFSLQESLTTSQDGSYILSEGALTKKCQMINTEAGYAPFIHEINEYNWPQRIDFPLIPDPSGEVMFIFTGNNMPTMDELYHIMAGFDDWGIFTLDQLPVDIIPPENMIINPFVFETPLPFEEDLIQDEESSTLSTGGLGGMGAKFLFTGAGRYYYRALAQSDPALAQVLAEGLIPRQFPDGIYAAQSRADMTFRHTRVLDPNVRVGTDRISTGKNLKLIYEIGAKGRGEYIRIDPNKLSEGQFLHYREVLADLNKMEKIIESEFKKATSKTKINKWQNRLYAIRKAKSNVRGFKEGHGVKIVHPEAIKSVRIASPRSQMFARGMTHGLRVVGGVLIVYGIYKSGSRIINAPSQQRGRVIAQEIGGWVGGFAGAWALGSLFGAAGAALGLPVGGVGAVIVGTAGMLIGGIFGFILGYIGADWIYTRIEGSEKYIESSSELLLGELE